MWSCATHSKVFSRNNGKEKKEDELLNFVLEKTETANPPEDYFIHLILRKIRCKVVRMLQKH